MDEGRSPSSTQQELRVAAARRKKLLRRIILAAVVLFLVGSSAWVTVRFWRQAGGNRPGLTIPDQGAPHVALDTPFEYNSNPPTSGPHHITPAEWGVYPEEIHDQILIHNLEHGGIWIAYKPGIDSVVVAKLEVIAKEFGRKVIMAPRAANDADVALAAWNHLDKFSSADFSQERVRTFIKAYRNKGPEFVP